jgi:hypothetical protein
MAQYSFIQPLFSHRPLFPAFQFLPADDFFD